MGSLWLEAGASWGRGELSARSLGRSLLHPGDVPGPQNSLIYRKNEMLRPKGGLGVRVEGIKSVASLKLLKIKNKPTSHCLFARLGVKAPVFVLGFPHSLAAAVLKPSCWGGLEA